MLRPGTSGDSHIVRLSAPVILLAAAAVYVIYARLLTPLQRSAFSTQEPVDASLAFVIGLLTSAHCIWMCGGFVLACAHRRPARTVLGALNLKYAVGKTVSYSMIGALCGALGKSVTVTLSQRAGAEFGCGLLLIAVTLCPLRWAEGLQTRLTNVAQKWSGAFAIGLLNGGMLGCGPLLSLYLIAASTCSPLKGGVLLFSFGLGTLPSLLGWSALTHYLRKPLHRSAHLLTRVLLVVFGLMMLNSARALWQAAAAAPIAAISDRQPSPQSTLSDGTEQVIRMRVTATGWIPNTFTLRDRVPVRWIIDANGMSMCTKEIEVPALNLSINMHPGENIVEFVPSRTGNIQWSCWMGMAKGNFFVQPNANGAK